MTEGLWAAIIGVGGTIIGTLLGFFLGKIDLGKLQVKPKKENGRPCYNCGELFEYHQNLVISLYNGSNKNKVFREVKIVLKDSNDSDLLFIPLKDLTINRGNTTENLCAINIQPQTGIDIKAKYVIEEDMLEAAYKAKKVFLHYQNEKFESKLLALWDCDYEKIAKLQNKDKYNG